MPQVMPVVPKEPEAVQLSGGDVRRLTRRDAMQRLLNVMSSL